MGAAMIRLNGGDPTISDGLKVANANLKRIAGWALVSATVGLVLRALAERFGAIGRIVAGFAGFAWARHISGRARLDLREDRTLAAVKRSGSLLRQTWGEAAAVSHARCDLRLARAAGVLFLVVGGLIGGIVGSSSESRSPSSTGYSSGSSEPPRRASS